MFWLLEPVTKSIIVIGHAKSRQMFCWNFRTAGHTSIRILEVKVHREIFNFNCLPNCWCSSLLLHHLSGCHSISKKPELIQYWSWPNLVSSLTTTLAPSVGSLPEHNCAVCCWARTCTVLGLFMSAQFGVRFSSGNVDLTTAIFDSMPRGSQFAKFLCSDYFKMSLSLVGFVFQWSRINGHQFDATS